MNSRLEKKNADAHVGSNLFSQIPLGAWLGFGGAAVVVVCLGATAGIYFSLPGKVKERSEKPTEIAARDDAHRPAPAKQSNVPPPAVAPFDKVQATAHQEAWAKHLDVPVEFTNKIGMKLRLIPPESGQEAFQAGVHEVTVGQFRQFLKATGHKTVAERDPQGGLLLQGVDRKSERKPEYVWSAAEFADNDERPVVLVNWFDAQAFCTWLSSSEGRTYRLPTEREWEWLARGGSTQRWHFGDDATLLDEHAWHLENGGRRSQVVGGKKANPWGLCDVYGNVYEICAEWSTNKQDRVRLSDSTTGPTPSHFQIVRGGSYHDRADATSGWGWVPISQPYSHVGFRIVADVPQAR